MIFLRSGFRTSLIVVSMIAAALLPAAARAGSQCDPVASFEVDAWTRKMTEPSRDRIRCGAKVRLVVKDPNVFRESYELKLEGKDLHGNVLPEALKGLFGVVLGTVRDLPPLYEISSKKGLPEPLVAAYESARAALRDIKANLRPGFVLGGLIASPLLDELVSARDDADVRRRAAKAAGDVFENWVADKNAADRFRRASENKISPDTAQELSRSVGNLRVLVDTTATGWIQRWSTVESEYQKLRSTYSGSDSKIVAFDKAIQDGNDWLEGLKKDITARRTEIQNFIEIAHVALDPIRTPDEIRRDATANGDEVVAQVIITPVVLGEKGLQALPSAPKVTISGSKPIYRRWTMDVSAGLAATGLRHHNFVAVPSADTSGTGQFVRLGSHDEVDVAPVTFAHVVYTFKWGAVPLAAGPTIGIMALSPVRTLLGGSLELGRGLRVALSGGRALGEDAVLNGERQDTQLVNAPLDMEKVKRTA